MSDNYKFQIAQVFKPQTLSGDLNSQLLLHVHEIILRKHSAFDNKRNDALFPGNSKPHSTGVVYQKKTTKINKRNIICFFSFLFITQNVQMGREKVEDRQYGFSMNIFPPWSSGRNLPGYIIFRAPTQILMLTSSAYRLHSARDHASFYHATHTIVLFTLGNRYVSSYFGPRVWLLTSSPHSQIFVIKPLACRQHNARYHPSFEYSTNSINVAIQLNYTRPVYFR